ncbi:carbonic anhydrase family protein [Bacillus luteolus]|uniref:Carbonic anhydrase n=1 Tax=Litchfieldia luteola TaxID=682179 RepID=A0ABR9QJD9_9BACI|nr:carbonic anhydrase family protein [Cytobacillus luteolus]MBE4908616.1 carbonic anhydrase family protein [Cytobacillus luteolus]MBP1941472.1 carbonic anhydrase [Cytobacillus luteolus]
MKGLVTLNRNSVTCFTYLLIALLCLYTLQVDKVYSSPPQENSDWSYQEKTGPDYWGSLDPSFVQCEKGASQSPINIDTSKVIEHSELKDISLNYTKSSFSITKKQLTLELLPEDKNNSLYIGEKEYVLKQIHFHYPSEHTLNGKKFPAEIHLVHQNRSGQLAVIGLFVEKGKENQVIKKFFRELPREIEKDQKVKEDINVENLLPEKTVYFRYDGSLTTPPCSEDVKWLVLNQSIEMSADQLNKLETLFISNSRPVQSIGKRKVYIKPN